MGYYKIMSFILWYCSTLSVYCKRSSPPTLAIIGGGMGGASAAYYARDLFGPDANIDVFEAKNFGGRLDTITIDGIQYEAGGSVIHPENIYMVNFTKMLGLKERDSDSRQFCIFDGKDIVFQSSEWTLVSLAKLAYKYGWDIMRLRSFISSLLSRFSNIYTFQHEGYAFSEVEKLLAAMSPDMPALLHETTRAHFKDEGFSDQLLDTLVQGALTCNYGQSQNVQAFVGSVSMAGATPGLWAVHGGNKQVPLNLLKKSDANLIKAQVTEIVHVSKPLEEYYHIEARKGNDIFEEDYDVVIIATQITDEMEYPLFKNFKHSIRDKIKLDYHQTVATFVKGTPNNTFFGLDKNAVLPEEVLVMNQDSFFNSLGLASPVDYVKGSKSVSREQSVWKVFSKKPLTPSQLDLLFTQRQTTKLRNWKEAYPHYPSNMQHFTSFELTSNLYYANAIEQAASAMEMAALGGRNAALLAFNKWYDIVEKIDNVVGSTSTKEEL